MVDDQEVRLVARKAAGLANAVEDESFRPAAFGVLFGYFLELGADTPRKSSSRRKAQAQVKTEKTSAPKTGPIQRIRELVEGGFFRTPRSLKSTIEELALQGYRYDKALVSKNLQRLVRERLLRRARGKEGGREVYLHTEW